MEPPASRHADSPRPTSLPHNQHGNGDGVTTGRSDLWLPSRDNKPANSNGSRHHSDRSTSSSRYTGPEPPSEHHLESSVGPEIVPPSPPAVPMDRHHNRTSSAHSLGPPHDYKDVVGKKFGMTDRPIMTPPPSRPLLHSSEQSLGHLPPPPPPNFSASHRRPKQSSDSDSDRSSVDRPPPNHFAWRSDSPRVPPPPYPPGLSKGPSSVLIPPPPPPDSPPHRSQPVRRVRKSPKPHRKKKRDYVSESISNKSGSSTFSYSKGRRARSLSGSTDDSGVDPVSARNARVFPPRFPAADTRAKPPTKSAAIHNITSWVHQYEREKARLLPRNATFITPPPPPQGLGNVRDDASSSYDDSSSDGSSSTDYSLANTIEHLWQALKDKRSKVAEIKSDMSQQRRELRALRRKRDDADNALMNVLRPMLVNARSVLNMSPTILRERMYEVQSLWNDYNHREAMYEGLELLLDEEEEALNYMEIRFFSVLAAGRTEAEIAPAPKERSSGPKYPSDVPLELRGISPDGPTEELHPRYIKLTSTVGDLQNAKEQHAELRAEREAVEEDIAVKRSTNQKIPVDTINSLEEYRQEEQRLGQRVESLRTQTEKLKELCQNEGVMRKHLSIGMLYFLDPTVEHEQEIDLDDIAPTNNPLRHARFPEILTQPEHIMASPLPLTTWAALKRAEDLPVGDAKNREILRIARKEYNIEHIFRGDVRQSKSEFVNWWLLQILQLSSLEVSCLYETFISQSGLFIRNTALWQRDVLHYWLRDDTVIPHEEGSDTESDDQKQRGSAVDFYVATPPLTRAGSAPLLAVSPISRAMSDNSSAKTLDGSFFPLGMVARGGDGRAGQVTGEWSGTTSPQIITRN